MRLNSWLRCVNTLYGGHIQYWPRDAMNTVWGHNVMKSQKWNQILKESHINSSRTYLTLSSFNNNNVRDGSLWSCKLKSPHHDNYRPNDLFFSCPCSGRRKYDDQKHREALINLYWSLLSVDGEIPLRRWQQLADLLQLDVTFVENSGRRKLNVFARYLPSLYESQISRAFRRMVVSKKFR